MNKSMFKDEVISTHNFVFNKCDNGGESLTLSTIVLHNGDPGKEGVFLNQELTLHSYCNSASFKLCGISLTPENLRELANQLESAINLGLSNLEKEANG